MFISMIRLLTIFSIVLGITGCSSLATNLGFHNRDKHYLSAKSVPPIRIPAGLTSNTIHQQYPVSDRVYPESAKVVNLTPPGLYDK